MNYRKKGLVVLQQKVDVDDSVDIENNIYSEVSDEEMYYLYVYQVMADLETRSIDDIKVDILNHNMVWDHSFFDSARYRQEEQDDFIEHPFEISEGALECRCGSKRVFSYSKQCRSCDESTTVFAECVACKSKWTT